MKKMHEINSSVQWLSNDNLLIYGLNSAMITFPSGERAHLIVGWDEDGWEHVSVMMNALRLPTWEEMCFVKDIFWNEEEEVVQIHPKKSRYVNFVEALHLWRPVDGNWSLMNRES